MKEPIRGRTWDEFPPQAARRLPGFVLAITSIDAGDVYHLPVYGTETSPCCRIPLARPYQLALPARGGIGWSICSRCQELEGELQTEIPF